MSRRGSLATTSLVAVVFAALLGSLSLVAWRQSRAFEANQVLDGVRRARSLAEAERADLIRRIQYLESRGRVVPEARRRLEMHLPAGEEMVFLDGEGA